MNGPLRRAVCISGSNGNSDASTLWEVEHVSERRDDELEHESPEEMNERLNDAAQEAIDKQEQNRQEGDAEPEPGT